MTTRHRRRADRPGARKGRCPASSAQAGFALGAHHSLEDLALAAQVARTIVQARIAAGLSQAELAARMSTAQSFVSKLESGRVLPSTTTLVKVARATGALLRLELVGPLDSIAPKGCGRADPGAP
jgi:ribosome-binding protein aMBF1 (putative translation factor)